MDQQRQGRRSGRARCVCDGNRRLVRLRDLLTPLRETFSETAQGQRRKVWFVYTLLAVAVPFTSSITSNVLRTLRRLFGLELESLSDVN